MHQLKAEYYSYLMALMLSPLYSKLGDKKKLLHKECLVNV